MPPKAPPMLWRPAEDAHAPKQTLTLKDEGEVHVWSSHADAFEGGAASLLDPSEDERAARFRFERDRSRFIAHRAFTRHVLSCYLGIAPAAVEFRAGPQGKPELDPALGLCFNTSRSGGLSVAAFARAHVGIDVEQLRPIDDASELADGHFTPRERQALRSAPRARRDEAFLVLWTRKEAVLKAFGLGLAAPLDTFDVAAEPGDATPGRGRLGGEPFVVSRLEVQSGWIAAVAMAGTTMSVRRMDPAMVAP